MKRKVPDSSRSHNGAHNGAQPPPQSRNPKIGVSPAVPSFGFQFPFASAPFVSQPQQEPVTSQTKEKKERTHNVLGLTPNGDEREDSDPEIDEEAQASLPAQAYVQNPNLPNLGLPSEVAKWVAERRRQYPTKARIEQKRQATRQAELVARQAEQAARQAELDRLKQKVIESQKSKAAQELKAKEVKDAKLKSKLDRHVRKAEKLRQQLLQAQAASESVQGQPGEARSSNPTKSNASLGIDYDSDSDQDVAIKESSSDVETSSDNDTSSTESDSEDSSSDEDAPEEQSSKASNTASLPTVRPRPDPIPVPDYLEPFVRKHYCTFFLLNGYCRNQKYKNCRYKHELPATLQGQQNGRPKLYDRVGISFSY